MQHCKFINARVCRPTMHPLCSSVVANYDKRQKLPGWRYRQTSGWTRRTCCVSRCRATLYTSVCSWWHCYTRIRTHPPLWDNIAFSTATTKWRSSFSHEINRLVDWGLTTFSAQIGYIVPLKSMLQVWSEINQRKLTKLHVGNTYNKLSNPSIWSL